MSNVIFLSHLLDINTPSYGNRNPMQLERQREICCGDRANDSYLHMSAHLGTHIDMPYHFHANGQTIEHFSSDFWAFSDVVVVEVSAVDLVIEQELIQALSTIDTKRCRACELLIVKTGSGVYRDEKQYWEHNYGFSPALYPLLKKVMPNVRVMGFDSISLTSFQYRDVGKLAHEAFLNPAAPILPLEDMCLDAIDGHTSIEQVIIAPLRLAQCDGLPCTVMAWVHD